MRVAGAHIVMPSKPHKYLCILKSDKSFAKFVDISSSWNYKSRGLKFNPDTLNCREKWGVQMMKMKQF